ncbi:uncharacterized protein LOC123322828 isoform X2 [Coccinella septempunctata]|uniref:uncharacterized protein LOC123322828 isoform X2 n=2 Tax=Coccinella septempunctata TaxID=41139 RepID=UPI001D0999B6|nr:uncharacterized protein LOC123322828 isoform X2 [Coccinella septempunctata]
MVYACSSRMRELSRFLIVFRRISGDKDVSLKEILTPRKFGTALSVVREIAGYDPVKKTFKTPSLAMHLGTSLKHVCNELRQLVLQESEGFRCPSGISTKEWIEDIRNFTKLIETRWTIELASLANKDLQEKKWNKPLLIPLVDDIMIFKDETLKLAEECVLTFNQNTDNAQTYKTLVHCTLALLILFNRRRIGDVQFLKINDYRIDRKTESIDFKNLLTESEKLLTKEYKRVVNCGKGSRAVVILVPQIIQTFINLLLERRVKYISPDNDYVFALPGSTVKWGKGDVAFRTLTKKMNLKHPEAIGSNRLRKHIATVMQILNLSKHEKKQFSNFMGHTEKTHEEFYELPVDIYQTAKVSKILLMMDKGTLPAEYKGKSLSEINLNVDAELVEENEVEELDSTTKYASVSSAFRGGFKNQSQETMKTNKNHSDDGDVEKSHDGELRSTACRKAWTDEEIEVLKREFGDYIKKNIYPSGAEIKEFMEKWRLNRSVKIIKSKIQHLIKLSNKVY